MEIKEIGTEVAKARRERGLSQDKLAKASGVSRITISKLERGDISELGIRKLGRVLAVLSLEITLRHASALPTLDDMLPRPRLRP